VVSHQEHGTPHQGGGCQRGPLCRGMRPQRHPPPGGEVQRGRRRSA